MVNIFYDFNKKILKKKNQFSLKLILQKNHIKNNCKIIWIGIDNKDKADVFAKNIKIDNLKMCFDVEFKNEECYHFETSILGRANIYNILSANIQLL